MLCYLGDRRSKSDVLKSPSSSVLLLAPFLLFSFPPAYAEQRTALYKILLDILLVMLILCWQGVYLEKLATFLLVHLHGPLFDSNKHSISDVKSIANTPCTALYQELKAWCRLSGFLLLVVQALNGTSVDG